mgnify:CR=1 FL=1
MPNNKSHILIVDDDTRLRSLLQRFLRENDFLVSTAKDADAARKMLKEYAFSLLIVDVMMPNENGTDFVAKLRKEDDVPVIMLTAMGETQDRITGLECGADDYIAKPFEPKELVLRINNILRRTAKNKKHKIDRINFGYCYYSIEKKELHLQNGEIVHITPVEQQLLNILSQYSGRVFSREYLAETLGGNQSPRSIDVQITRLRRKIEDDSKNPRYLQTVRGKGYMLLHDNK